MDYNKLGKDILTQVGGKENVSSVSHCITRVRFILKDEAKANDDVIKNMSGVLDVVKQGGQYQVVVGPSVEKVYNAIIEDGDIATNEGDSTAANTEDDKGFINKALGLVSSIFIPVLGMLSGSGMIKAVLALLSACGWLSPKDGTYIILSALSDALFYFFPVVLGWSAAKRFGLKEIYGITLGAFLVYPTLASAASGKAINTLFSGTVFKMDYQLTFLGIPVALQSYASTVIPIIAVIWFASYVYKFFNKHIPDVLKMVFVPFSTLIIAGAASLIVIGPISIVLQNLLSSAVTWLLNLNIGIAGFLIGSLWSILVMFGLHWAILPFFQINVSEYGYDIINPLIFSGAPAVLGSALGIALRTKNKDTRSMSFAAAISSFFGVSEPALYGVMIPRKMILITGLTAAGIGGAIAGLGGAKLYTFGAHGLLGFPTFISPDGIDGGFIALCISGVVAFAIALVSALVIGDKQDSTALLAKKAEEKAPAKAKEVTIVSPVNGQAVDLTGVSDQVFSQLLLGDGIAVIPSDGKVYAPEDAIVRVAYPTGHAVGLAGIAGDELLIHIGVDTVNLNGQYFTSHVEQGMKVKKGDLLVEFDLDGIKRAGYDPTVMVVVTKTEQLDTVTPLTQGTVDTTTPLLSINLK